MNRVTDERIQRALDAYDNNERPTYNIYFVVDVLRDLQDTRKALSRVEEELTVLIAGEDM